VEIVLVVSPAIGIFRVAGDELAAKRCRDPGAARVDTVVKLENGGAIGPGLDAGDFRNENGCGIGGGRRGQASSSQQQYSHSIHV
jgi:hypothetical protein